MLPKVLVISNNCFSKTDSNGRTLGGFFNGYPIDKLAQFYINKGINDFSVCNNYFTVSDSEALKSLYKKGRYGKIVNCDDNTNKQVNTVVTNKKSKKNPLTMLLRNFAWNMRKWWGEEFTNWVESFLPNLVLLQSGDSAFMVKLATDIAKKYNLPLVIYNSENYYFKNKNFMKNSGIWSLFYPLFISNYRSQFKKMINYASLSIYNTEDLKCLYDNKFNTSSLSIYTSTDVVKKDNLSVNNTPIVSYLGNLGVGRHKSLIELANALQSINENYKLNVYGKFPSEDIKNEMLACKGINYAGFVSYDKVVDVMAKSDLLVHVENFDSYYVEDLKYAFSTKIADSLACGTPFLIYAPNSLTETKFNLDNESAFCVTDKNLLKVEIEKALFNEDLRQKQVENAIKTTNKYFIKENNVKTFINALKSVYEANT